MTNKAVDYLKSIGCTTAVIHASDAGEHVYRAAGFELAKEMRLKFSAEYRPAIAGAATELSA